MCQDKRSDEVGLILHAGPCPKAWDRIYFAVILAFAFALILIRRRLWKIYILCILARPKNSGVNHQSGTANFVRGIIFHRAFRALACR